MHTSVVLVVLQIRELTRRCQQLREEAAAGSAAAAEEGRQAAALDTRQAQLLARCEDLARRIRELGSLSAEVFEKYQGKGVKVGGWLQCCAAVEMALPVHTLREAPKVGVVWCTASGGGRRVTSASPPAAVWRGECQHPLRCAVLCWPAAGAAL